MTETITREQINKMWDALHAGLAVVARMMHEEILDATGADVNVICTAKTIYLTGTDPDELTQAANHIKATSPKHGLFVEWDGAMQELHKGEWDTWLDINV